MSGLVTGLRNLSRTLAAVLTACLIALFVTAPAIDGVMCGGEDESVATATLETASTADTSAHHSGKSGAPDPGLGACLHGHCHHVQIAAAIPTETLVAATASHHATRPARDLMLASADLAHAKPPPRA